MKELHVVAGALLNSQGRVLIAQRPSGKHMAGGWEFPGGKLADNEAPLAGLIRELREELGVTVQDAKPVIAYTHVYPDRRVFLDLWLVREYGGVPQSCEGQALKWVDVDSLSSIGLLEADRPMIGALQRILTQTTSE